MGESGGGRRGAGGGKQNEGIGNRTGARIPHLTSPIPIPGSMGLYGVLSIANRLVQAVYQLGHSLNHEKDWVIAFDVSQVGCDEELCLQLA